jgi:hypothetical protein
MIHWERIPTPPTGLASAKAAAKEAFRAMSNAATKAANVFAVMASEAVDPKMEQALRDSAAAWQKSSKAAWEEMNKL